VSLQPFSIIVVFQPQRGRVTRLACRLPDRKQRTAVESVLCEEIP
jgi:hypothetical protein